MEDDIEHPLDAFQDVWKSARRRAAAGSLPDAVTSLATLLAFLEVNVPSEDSPNPPGLPRWLVDDLIEILGPSIKDGSSLDRAFHLERKRGRSLIENEQRDMGIDAMSGSFESLESFADAAERLGFPPPKPGEPWTADALAKAMKAHARRIKSGLLFLGPGDSV